MNYIKYIAPIFLMLSFSPLEQSDIPELWNQVEALEKKGLTKSAREKVVEIRELAIKAELQDQLIKSLLYESKYALILDEHAQLQIVNNFKEEILKSKSPTKNILENYLAGLYWQYFQQNRYRFYNRSNIGGEVNQEDFRTWDLETLYSEISRLYSSSLKNKALLQSSKIDDYKAIIEEHEGSEIVSPSLYNVLIKNAIQFFQTDEQSISQPSYKFTLDNPDFLKPFEEFVRLNITDRDSVSNKLKALQLYQNLIGFHLDNNQKAALVTADIERLNYVWNNMSIVNKDTRFIQTLEYSSNIYKNSEEWGLYQYEIAKVFVKQGQEFQAGVNPVNQWKFQEALSICNEVINDFPKSIAADQCKALKSTIVKSSLTISSEEMVPIDTYSKALLRYKNLSSLQLKIYKVTTDQIRQFNRQYREDDQLEFLESIQPINTFNESLKNEGDYQNHSIEIPLPPLKNGHYILLAETIDDSIRATSTLQATNFALVEKDEPNFKLIQIINRLSGAPIKEAQVDVSYKVAGSSTYQNLHYETDDKGQLKMNRGSSNYRDIKVLVQEDGNTGYFENLYVYRDYGSPNGDNIQYSAFIFSDRSIYRPGQNVYFKGIALKRDGDASEVIQNEQFVAELIDANDQIVKSLTVKTNEFGSVSGEFILPNTTLNGQFQITLKSDRHNLNAVHYFSVEDYKRPTFKVDFDPLKDRLKVNDTITIHVKALGYAGNNISNADVEYRVVRKTQLPRWYYWSHPWYNSETQEIISGTTSTDVSGRFSIPFKAIPDTSIDKGDLPIFQYEIIVDVTDLNGETRSNTTTVQIGYHDIITQINLPDKVNRDNVDSLTVAIDTENLNGEAVSANGTLTIYKLIAPESVIKSRRWASPDYKSMSKDEFKTLFPFDAFNNEDEPQNWDLGTKVYSAEVNTAGLEDIKIRMGNNWISGMYKAIFSLDNPEEKPDLQIKDEQLFQLYSTTGKVSDNQLFEITLDKNSYASGETALLGIGSAAKNITITVDIEKHGTIVNTLIYNLSNEKKTLEIPITKKDIGGFAIYYSYAFHNDYHSGSLLVPIPYPKTDLQIETLSFRDRLQPNMKEEWEFRIKGPQGEKVTSEVLASMYDLSLDQFQSHDWSFYPLSQPIYQANNTRRGYLSFNSTNFRVFDHQELLKPAKFIEYNSLKWFGLSFGYSPKMYLRGKVSGLVEETEMDMPAAPQAAMNISDASEDLEEIVVTGYSVAKDEVGKREDNAMSQLPIRTNFNETAFFLPKLKTDANGHISFSFNAPEALTTWKLQLLAHTKELSSAIISLESITQKDLMVIPNVPRFFRQGDTIVLKSKIANITSKIVSGNAELILEDAISGAVVSDAILGKDEKQREFNIDENSNTEVSWTLVIPDNIDAIQYKIVAKSGDVSDGEQNIIPVLSNRKLITETLPIWVRGNESRTFTLNKLNSYHSNTLQHHKLTLEVSSNPAWYAVQSLPYLMEYPYDCNEQIFSRVYANSLARYIIEKHPRIKTVFNQWASADALLSNLEKNKELKSILINETPWLRDAESEKEQKKRIGLLFDLNTVANELRSSLIALKANQMENGAWAWFQGGDENRFITQHILTGIGHLNKLTDNSFTLSKEYSPLISSMIPNAMAYLDAQFIEEYRNLKNIKDVDLSKDHLTPTQIHYLYMRSFFSDIPISSEAKTIMDYYNKQINKYWLKKNLYTKGLMALYLNRNNDKGTAMDILKSLEETSVFSEELGMYWKENTSSIYWFQAPIETQALMIEAFSEIKKDTRIVDNLKIWLLKHKQTNSWKTTKATTDAVYALLLQGQDWLSISENVVIKLGDEPIPGPKLNEVKPEAATGYYKINWDKNEIQPHMAEVQISKTNEGVAWGAMYWQYFEDLDKITNSNTPLQLKKTLYKRIYSDKGESILNLTDSTSIDLGDLIRVRVELKVDRDMEYVHMKDMRASGLEPVNVLSAYKWQDGLGYYESTRDASTDFFFDYLPKGIYVFEYDLRVNNAGNMSNGITTIQSMYAPEFSSHSNGVRLKVND